MNKAEVLYQFSHQTPDKNSDIKVDTFIELAYDEGYKNGLSSKQEHITTVQDCELAVKVTKEKAIDALSSVLDNWVHGGDADCIIAEFEEILNNE